MTTRQSRSNGQTKIYEMITDRIVALLEQGEIPWRKPWVSGAPKNLVSKKEYRGINPFILLASGYASPWWLTFKQARQLKGKIRKGEKGYPVIFWKWIERTDTDQETGEPVANRIPLLRYYTVFNVEQTQNIEAPAAEKRIFHPIAQAESIVEKMPQRPALTHNERRAYYRPTSDTVNLPQPRLFASDEAYYSTLFHELVHATGHASRLNRKEITEVNLFGSHAYSREELVAELGAAFVGGFCNIAPQTLANSAAYIQGWLQKLRSDKKFLVLAAAKAQKAADYILNITY